MVLLVLFCLLRIAGKFFGCGYREGSWLSAGLVVPLDVSTVQSFPNRVTRKCSSNQSGQQASQLLSIQKQAPPMVSSDWDDPPAPPDGEHPPEPIDGEDPPDPLDGEDPPEWPAGESAAPTGPADNTYEDSPEPPQAGNNQAPPMVSSDWDNPSTT
jgi:hypothetical protein